MFRPLNPDDVNTRNMCVNTPFYKWLATHDQPLFIEAIRIYLNMGPYGEYPALTGECINTYRNIHTTYYWVQHTLMIRKQSDEKKRTVR